jgi:hypothetical protein
MRNTLTTEDESFIRERMIPYSPAWPHDPRRLATSQKWQTFLTEYDRFTNDDARIASGFWEQPNILLDPPLYTVEEYDALLAQLHEQPAATTPTYEDAGSTPATDLLSSVISQ